MRKQNNNPLPEHYQLLEYTILKVLSTGGFSIVYLAKDKRGSLVVIKEYVPANFSYRQDDGSQIMMIGGKERSFKYGMSCFFQEGQALSKLSHPNIVRILNFFRANGTVYLVLRYEEGQTLHGYVKSKGSRDYNNFSEKVLLKIFIHVLSGLRKIHSCRFLHLDVKPANIYLRKDFVPVLIDFGSARQVFSAMPPNPNAGIPMYTHGYSAPEQYKKSGFLGPWSDFYALGASLYACMARKAPQSAYERLKVDRLVPAKMLFKGLYSSDLLELVDLCLSLDVSKRPGSGYEIQSALISIFNSCGKILYCEKRVNSGVLLVD
ncbi:serine/threonine protein kinase [Candidatus Ichthyocystis sparus]|uniref:serine/threonine protein kinase n=1 Tax=Candidatus Ichthyocystis sparus TaxID=1561004 RepID=UPI000A87CBC0|nr:serine/threonine-protein kinase [Candidatus Ichthyocystis sparus]